MNIPLVDRAWKILGELLRPVPRRQPIPIRVHPAVRYRPPVWPPR